MLAKTLLRRIVLRSRTQGESISVGADGQWSVGVGVFTSTARRLEEERGFNSVSVREDEGVSWMKVVKKYFIFPWVGK